MINPIMSMARTFQNRAALYKTLAVFLLIPIVIALLIVDAIFWNSALMTVLGFVVMILGGLAISALILLIVVSVIMDLFASVYVMFGGKLPDGYQWNWKSSL